MGWGDESITAGYLLADGKACKSIFRHTQGFKERSFDSSGFSAELGDLKFCFSSRQYLTCNAGQRTERARDREWERQTHTERGIESERDRHTQSEGWSVRETDTHRARDGV